MFARSNFLSLLSALFALVALASARTGPYRGDGGATTLVDAWPQITKPKAGSVFLAGSEITIAWDQNIAKKYSAAQLGQTASFQLYYTLNSTGSEFHGTQTIVKDVQLYGNSSSVQVTLPVDLLPKQTYHVALVGSTADQSKAFTIL